MARITRNMPIMFNPRSKVAVKIAILLFLAGLIYFIFFLVSNFIFFLVSNPSSSSEEDNQYTATYTIYAEYNDGTSETLKFTKQFESELPADSLRIDRIITVDKPNGTAFYYKEQSESKRLGKTYKLVEDWQLLEAKLEENTPTQSKNN